MAIHHVLFILVFLQNGISFEVSISKRENVISDLDHKEREINIGELKIYVFDLGIRRLLLIPVVIPIVLLPTRPLVNRYLEP